MASSALSAVLALRFLLPALVLVPMPALADEPGSTDDPLRDAESRWHAGVLLGVNMNSAFGAQCTLDCNLDLTSLGVEGFDPHARLRTADHLTAGAFVSYRVNPRYRLRVEARLVEKGVSAQHAAPVVVVDEIDGEDTPRFAVLTYELTHAMRYVQVPVLVQREIPYDNVFRPHLMAGLGVGYAWSGKSSGEGDILDAETFNNIGTVTGEGDTGDVLSTFDISVIVGADMAFPLSRGAIELGIRYELSVLASVDGIFATEFDSSRPLYLPLTATPSAQVELTSTNFVAESLRNRVLSVTAGYRF